MHATLRCASVLDRRRPWLELRRQRPRGRDRVELEEELAHDNVDNAVDQVLQAIKTRSHSSAGAPITVHVARTDPVETPVLQHGEEPSRALPGVVLADQVGRQVCVQPNQLHQHTCIKLDGRTIRIALPGMSALSFLPADSLVACFSPSVLGSLGGLLSPPGHNVFLSPST